MHLAHRSPKAKIAIPPRAHTLVRTGVCMEEGRRQTVDGRADTVAM
jgi:hypothetical protein